MHECHSKVTHSDGGGALVMDVQVGEVARRYRVPWLHGPGPAAERVGAGNPRAFGLPSAGDQFCWGHTFEVGINVRWEGMLS